MHIIQQALFILLLAVAIYIFTRKVKFIRRNILLGRSAELNDHPRERWRNMLLLALGQKKMFRNWIPAILHLFVYAGFIIINIEILEIILDGITGRHRLFEPLLGPAYNVLIGCFEILAGLVITGCVIFLIRRNILKIRRFQAREMTAWPKSDANYILITEIILMLLFLTMNASDQSLQAYHAGYYTQTGPFWISSLIAPAFHHFHPATLAGMERGAWWLHITGVLVFLNYLPYSKHFHIILAFPNAYYADLQPKGTMQNMPEIQHEVELMFNPVASGTDIGSPVQRFGAKDVSDLSWKNLMDAYSCTECGRCTAACPANITGKLLSPRKIMMDTRDRLEEVGKNIALNKEGFKDDGRSLLNDYITEEELRACTTCNACVEECPVSINPLSIILQLRRYLVMEAASAPPEWNAMFSNIENNRAPWKFPPEERGKWAE